MEEAGPRIARLIRMRRKLSAFLALVGFLSVLGLPSACGTPTSMHDNTDTDGDGLSDRDEIFLYKTSPLLADTDGDGWSDYAEVIDFAFDPERAPYRFNPRIADLPELAIVFTSPPVLTFQVTETTGEEWTVETRLISESTLTVTTSLSTTDSQSDTISTPTEIVEEEQVSGTVVVSPGADEDDERDRDGGADEDGGDDDRKKDKDGNEFEFPELDVTRELTVTRSRAVATGFEPSSTVETSITLTDEQSAQYAEAIELVESYTSSQEVTAISGRMLITATIQNRGNVAFRIINLILSATMVNEPPAFTPVGNLYIDAERYSDFQPFSLAPGEVTAPLNFVRFDLTLEASRAIFDNAHALLIQLGLFEIDDATGRAFAFTINEARTKTALVMIDYGDHRRSEWHHVATKSDPSRAGITLGEAFEDILRIPFEASWATGLSRVRDVGPGRWAMSIDSDNGAGMVTTTTYDAMLDPYDFNSVEIYAGDTIRLVYLGR